MFHLLSAIFSEVFNKEKYSNGQLYHTHIDGRKRQKHVEGLPHICVSLYLHIAQFL